MFHECVGSFGRETLYEVATPLGALRVLEERYPDRPLKTNVEYYTAAVLQGVGLPPDLFPATFAMARTAGWTAHSIEQLREVLATLFRLESWEPLIEETRYDLAEWSVLGSRRQRSCSATTPMRF